MKKHILILLTITSGLTYATQKQDHCAKKCPVDAEPLRIATWNIRRLGGEMDPKNRWATRKSLVFDMVHAIHPDIIGLQEVVKEQLDDLKAQFPAYEAFGKPRSTAVKGLMQRGVMKHPKAKDEHNPLLYNTERVALVTNGDFGINPRGHFMRAFLPRICTWGCFKDKETGDQLYVYNTHLDNSSSIIRRKQIDKICKHVKRHTHGLPVIFMGDFNTPLDKSKKKQRILALANFVNAKELAQQVLGPTETRTGWNNSELKKIDHIFVKSPQAIIPLYQVVASPAGVFPSDHRPVVIDINVQ